MIFFIDGLKKKIVPSVHIWQDAACMHSWLCHTHTSYCFCSGTSYDWMTACSFSEYSLQHHHLQLHLTCAYNSLATPFLTWHSETEWRSCSDSPGETTRQEGGGGLGGEGDWKGVQFNGSRVFRFQPSLRQNPSSHFRSLRICVWDSSVGRAPDS